MKFFNNYTSATIAGTSNQSFFITEDENKIYTARLFYKLSVSGEYPYSFLLSNMIDSTFSDGSYSRKNRIIDSWSILNMRACITKGYDDETVGRLSDFVPVTFNASTSKEVMPGELFATDEVVIKVDKGDFICIEIEFRGKEIPSHPESLIPSFVREGEMWIPTKNVPVISMIGVRRPVKAKIAFWGDSITQGIGTAENSYQHWNSLIADMLGDEYSCWNLGIGYGRAEDAASLGSWFFKAKQADILVVCFGVNDLLRNNNADDIKSYLCKIVKELKAMGKKVLLQTIPPFDYNEEKRRLWIDLNTYIKTELSDICDAFFDNNQVLSLDPENTHKAKFGGHPNAQGCKEWANALYPKLKDILT